MMFDGFDEADLLALVEDELEPARAQALRARLAVNPHALAVIDAMRRDRAGMRAQPQPILPGDLLAELESAIARPMLMPPAPAPNWRRKYRKRRWPRRAAVAAAIGLLGLGGVWAGAEGITALLDLLPHGDDLAARDDTTEVGTPPRGQDVVVALGPAPVVEPPPADSAVAVSDPDPRATRRERRAAPGRRSIDELPAYTAAQFALVVESADVAAVEATLTGLLDGERTALVRNFSYEEAGYLADRLNVERGLAGLDELVEAWAAAEPGPTPLVSPRADRRKAQELARHLQSLRHDQDAVARSSQLAGARRDAPPYETQLSLSERGASHTVTVPARRLNEVLAALAERFPTRLAILHDDEGSAAGSAAQRLRDYEQARQAAAALEGDVVVYLPVVIGTP